MKFLHLVCNTPMHSTSHRAAPPPYHAAPDARLSLLLAALLGSVVWHSGAPGLCGFVLCLFCLVLRAPLRGRMPRGSVRRCLLFALFWPLLKLGADAVSLLFFSQAAKSAGQSAEGMANITRFFAHTGASSIPADMLPAVLSLAQALAPFCADAGLLFLRLLNILLLGLALSLAFSPPALALALSRLLRPFLGQRAWPLALALALMLRFMGRIHTVAAQTRQAALLRGLPPKGWGFFSLALPHMFRVFAAETYTQALAIAARHLDSPAAWPGKAPVPPAQAIAALCGAVFILLAARL